MDGARRLGRMARLLSIVSIVLGTIIIVLYVSLSVRGNVFSFPRLKQRPLLFLPCPWGSLGSLWNTSAHRTHHSHSAGGTEHCYAGLIRPPPTAHMQYIPEKGLLAAGVGPEFEVLLYYPI